MRRLAFVSALLILSSCNESRAPAPASPVPPAPAAQQPSPAPSAPSSGDKATPPPPRSKTPAICAVTDFTDRTVGRRGASAADQLDALVRASNRFELMDRREVRQRQAEQESGGAGGVATAGRRGVIPGADYVLGGSIDQFRVTLVSPAPDAPAPSEVAKQEVNVEVAVTVQLTHAATGELVAKETRFLKKQAVSSIWSIRVLGIGGNKELRIDNDSAARILRQALEPIYKKMLPVLEEQLGDSRR
jgi:curli biogenesis system outer membrane secretion channel CsgG